MKMTDFRLKHEYVYIHDFSARYISFMLYTLKFLALFPKPTLGRKREIAEI